MNIISENATFELKKSRTIEDRIDKLQKRHLLIDDYQLLYNYIKKINTYYHITGYRFLLDNYDVEEDDYHGHKCTELIALCELDKKISIMLFQETRKIEESLRTRLANLCGQNDMVTFKLDNIRKISLLKDNYCLVNDSIEKFIAEDTFNRILSKSLYNDINKTREEPAIKHYINAYNGIIPIWVAINFISFGILLKLIDCLTTVKLNEFMEGKPYKKPKGAMEPSRVDLKAIHMLRNKISHHSNILGKRSPYIVKRKSYSIFLLGYISICHWSNFLFNENITIPLRQKIDKIIEETNTEYNIKFDFSIIHNRKIK
ncbi:MAG: Abi family protein [Thomasclavelia sp.]